MQLPEKTLSQAYSYSIPDVKDPVSVDENSAMEQDNDISDFSSSKRYLLLKTIIWLPSGTNLYE